jgi:hypothetical protein
MNASLLQLAAAALSGGLLQWLSKPIWGWLRNASEHQFTQSENLQHLVDALRIALDKGRLREDALAQVLGVLIFGLKQIEDLSPALRDALERAIAILRQVQNQLRSMSSGGFE